MSLVCNISVDPGDFCRIPPMWVFVGGAGVCSVDPSYDEGALCGKVPYSTACSCAG